MAKVRQAYGETRFVPGLGRQVEHGEVVDVPDDELAGYLEAGWLPGDKATTATHQKLLAAGTVTVGTLKKSAAASKAEAGTGEADEAEADADVKAQEG